MTAMSSWKLPAVGVGAAALVGLLAAIATACSDGPSPAGRTEDGGLDVTPTIESGADGSAVVPKGARTLGISMPIGDVAFAENVQIAYDSGVRTTNVSLA